MGWRERQISGATCKRNGMGDDLDYFRALYCKLNRVGLRRNKKKRFSTSTMTHKNLDHQIIIFISSLKGCRSVVLLPKVVTHLG